ncbi:hypothetical protein WKW79_24470 [Variovorax robiniae]|uniref:Uncharacterized protein n=1 Tax=Variovorax robiniae TaxID=1836199 RepID=A0ABU8XFF5_9BURK
MNKKEYLAQAEDFVDWLAKVLHDHEIGFRHQRDLAGAPHGSGIYRTLHDALLAYAWPAKATQFEVPEVGSVRLEGKASFERNHQELARLQQGLRAAMADAEGDPFDWVAAILTWGGVYTKKGNRGWVEANRSGLRAAIEDTARALRQDSDDFSGMPDLRFNSGFTKVYALLLDDFIIYDSRVAAALAWLVCKWERDTGAKASELLRFGCLPANQGNLARTNPATIKIRRPDPILFRQILRADEHAQWNVRANWLLHAAFEKRDREACAFQSPREIEAALFMMGADLRHAPLPPPFAPRKPAKQAARSAARGASQQGA